MVFTVSEHTARINPAYAVAQERPNMVVVRVQGPPDRVCHWHTCWHNDIVFIPGLRVGSVDQQG
jgi:hypothetical protein